MRFTPRWAIALAGLLVAVVAGGFATYSLREHGRQTPALTAKVDQAKGAATLAAVQHAAATHATDAALDTLRKTVTVYDTLRKGLLLAPLTAADTARLLGQIPRFVIGADGLRDKATGLELTLLGERAASKTLDSTRVAVIHAQDELIAALRYVPPIESQADVRYDPIGKVYGAGAQLRYRVVRDWSLGVGAEKWLGGDGRGYVLVSHPIF